MGKLKKLTMELALEAVIKIKNQIGDDEVAHGSEDSLYLWFIECVAAGMYTKKESIAIAEHIKVTQDFGFARWCA